MRFFQSCDAYQLVGRVIGERFQLAVQLHPAHSHFPAYFLHRKVGVGNMFFYEVFELSYEIFVNVADVLFYKGGIIAEILFQPRA